MFIRNRKLLQLDIKSTPVEIEEDTETQKLFLKIAGEDGEINWVELKEILDCYTKKETPVSKANMNGSLSPPPQSQTTESGDCLTPILGLFCGLLCKDTPLADIIPAPANDHPLNSLFAVKDHGVSKDICRSMISMLDHDRSGQLNFEEFKILWNSIRTWKNVFKLYDADASGALSGFELREALNSAGYTVNNRILNILMHRYGNKKGELNFDDFILCAIKLKTMIDLFHGKDKNKTNTATFTFEEWLENTLCC